MKNCKSNNNAKIIDGLEETISYLRTRTSEVSERCIQYQRETIAMLKERQKRIETLEKNLENLEKKYTLLLKDKISELIEENEKLNLEMNQAWKKYTCHMTMPTERMSSTLPAVSEVDDSKRRAKR